MARKTKMNSITSPELLEQVNPKNTELLKDFIEYMRSLQRSEATIAGYRNDIEIAFVWCLQHNDNAFYVDWTKRQIVKYQNWLLGNNENSPARIRRLKASLSSLGNYIENVLDDEFPNYRNIINKIESPVVKPVREKTVFTEEQMKELLDLLTESKAYDKACVLALALYSGRRKSELLRFRVSDFTDDRLVCDGALYKTAPIKTKGRGVDGKMLECFCLAREFKPYLERWNAYKKEQGIESEWLFPEKNDPRQQIKVSVLNSWAKTFTRLLGVNFYWHAVRHMTVTNFKRAGMPDTVIQQYIGWEDISMVPIYSDMEADEQLGLYFGSAKASAAENNLNSLL